MQVPFYILIRPIVYLVAIILFWHVARRKGSNTRKLAAIMGGLFAVSATLSFWEASAGIEAVIPVGESQIPYPLVKALLENVCLFGIVGSFLALLTRRLDVARKEAQQLSQIASGAADSIIAIDKRGAITSWNLGAQMVFGYFPEETAGAKIDKIVPDGSRAQFDAALEKCGKEGFLRGVSISLVGKGRKKILTEVTLSRIVDEDGVSGGTSLFIRDVTEAKDMEAELIQSSKMTAMGTMAAGVVHEFGNLLTVISGRAQLGKSARTIEEANEAFAAILACAGRAKSVTNNLLAYAKRQPPHKTRGQVSQSLDAALFLVEKELTHANITVTRAYSQAPDTAFDRDQMTQVFVNLLINALNAMRSTGGKIEVAVGIKQDYIEVSVRDSGPGIPDDIMPRLFESFSTSGGTAGGSARTGLGLYVCREIIKFHSGTISVESHKGKGTAFRVYLPVIEAAEENAPAEGARLGARAACRVAVIDRDNMLRDLLAEALRRRGVTAEAFQDAASAEAAHADAKFDMAFVDVSIRTSDGVRYIEELKKRNGFPVVALIGEAVDAEEMRRLEEGTLKSLRKPFGLEEINSICEMVAPSKAGKAAARQAA